MNLTIRHFQYRMDSGGVWRAPGGLQMARDGLMKPSWKVRKPQEGPMRASRVPQEGSKRGPNRL